VKRRLIDTRLRKHLLALELLTLKRLSSDKIRPRTHWRQNRLRLCRRYYRFYRLRQNRPRRSRFW